MRKNILLIGGSHGIGFEIAQSLLNDHAVYIASRTNENLGNLDVNHIAYDAISDTLDLSGLPERIDGFVYCPGTINLKPFTALDIETFRSDIELNFISLVKTVQQLMPYFLKSEQASLVFFSTVAVKVGMPYHTSVAAAKGAIEGFAKALAAEQAPKIRVNVIAPSLTETPLAKRLLNNERKVDLMNARHPLQRFGQAKDVSNAAVFLLSEQSSWITGQVLGVDGGTSTLNLQ